MPRLGSNEDRAEAYRRLLDASARSFGRAYQFAHLRREAGRSANKVLLSQLPQAWEVSSELIGALQGVRLCGSVHVIATAEALVAATGDLDLNEKSADRFQQQADAVVIARDAFLDALHLPGARSPQAVGHCPAPCPARGAALTDLAHEAEPLSVR
ncbi:MULTISPECIES: hypothetical protein [unclassified Streptomyces]|uniref:hypothetical protein n=1 Tax=unclassified Streptomyces TaxID=2593676 RepID=UPI0036EED4F9